jgi:hypothetical protein
MATEKRQPPGNPGGRRRRPPTIELEATEVAGKPATASPPEAGVGADVAANPATERPPEQGSQSDPPPRPEPPRGGKSPAGKARGGIAWLPPEFPWPTVAAGAAGALLMFLLIWTAGLTPRGSDPMLTLAPRLTAIETQLRELAARPQPVSVDPKAVEALTVRIAKVESAVATPATPITDAAMLDRLARTDDAVKALATSVADLTRRTDAVAAALAELQQSARAGGTADPGALAALTNRIAKLEDDDRADKDDVAKRIAAIEQADRAGREELVKRMGAIEQSIQAIRDELAKRVVASGSDRPVRLAMAAVALRSAVERGASFATELATVKPLAANTAPLAALEPFAAAGLPSDAALAAELGALIEPMLRVVGSPPRDGGILDRLQANAQKLVRIRPVDEALGDEPAAVIARIEFKAKRMDIAGALAEFAKLPPGVRAPAQAWIAKAQARNAAVAAAHGFAADAIVALRTP